MIYCDWQSLIWSFSKAAFKSLQSHPQVEGVSLKWNIEYLVKEGNRSYDCLNVVIT